MRGLADREPLGEVVESDPGGDRHGQMKGLLPVTDGGLRERHRAGTDAHAAPPDRLTHVEQAHQAHAQPDGVAEREPDEPDPRAAGLGGGQGPVEDVARVREDVHQQEGEDPGRDPVQERLDPDVLHLDAAHRQPEEDREPGDGPEDRHARRAHHRHLPETAPTLLTGAGSTRQKSYPRGRIRGKFVCEPSLDRASRPAADHAADPSETLARMRLVPEEGVERERRKLFLLDGHSLAYRAFFALPPTLATSSGTVTNAVYGFTSMLIKMLAEEKPDLIAVAFDKGRPTIRLQQYAEYKAGRAEAPDEFRQQLGLIREVLHTLNIPIVEVEGHEADDAIATLACRAAERGLETTIVTADRDFFQLARPGIEVLFNRRGISDIARYDEAAVTERFGLPPSKYLDYVALKGDPSDNIPGVPGIGEKTASKLVQDYGSVEGVLEHTEELKPRVRAGIEAAGQDLIRNKELARLVCDVPL